MRAILVILAEVLVASALGGCASVAWVKDGSTPEQLAEDMKRCEQDAWYEARANTWYYRPMSPAYIPSATSGRFVFSPAYPYFDPFNDPAMQEIRLAQFCMRNKGYELKEVEKPASG